MRRTIHRSPGQCAFFVWSWPLRVLALRRGPPLPRPRAAISREYRTARRQGGRAAAGVSRRASFCLSERAGEHPARRALPEGTHRIACRARSPVGVVHPRSLGKPATRSLGGHPSLDRAGCAYVTARPSEAGSRSERVGLRSEAEPSERSGYRPTDGRAVEWSYRFSSYRHMLTTEARFSDSIAPQPGIAKGSAPRAASDSRGSPRASLPKT